MFNDDALHLMSYVDLHMSMLPVYDVFCLFN